MPPGESASDGYRWDGQTLVLELRLQPRASGCTLVGISNGRLRVRVTAAPVGNAANKQLIAMIAKEFGVAKSRVSLLAGAGKRDKRVAIEDPRRWPSGTQESTWRRIFARKASP